jgi:hypothetical protein
MTQRLTECNCDTLSLGEPARLAINAVDVSRKKEHKGVIKVTKSPGSSG